MLQFQYFLEMELHLLQGNLTVQISGQTKQFFGRKAETENDPPQKAKILAERLV